MYLHCKFCENPSSRFWDSVCRIFLPLPPKENPHSNEQFWILKKSKNILAILFLHILHMVNFKKLALTATEIKGKTSAETGETVTDPKTIPPAVFQKWEGGNNGATSLLHLSSKFGNINILGWAVILLWACLRNSICCPETLCPLSFYLMHKPAT